MRRLERTVPEIAADSAFGIACGASGLPVENLAELFLPEYFSAASRVFASALFTAF